jgi:23S rRNA pseudouridine2605 synthase
MANPQDPSNPSSPHDVSVPAVGEVVAGKLSLRKPRSSATDAGATGEPKAARLPRKAKVTTAPVAERGFVQREEATTSILQSLQPATERGKKKEKNGNVDKSRRGPGRRPNNPNTPNNATNPRPPRPKRPPRAAVARNPEQAVASEPAQSSDGIYVDPTERGDVAPLSGGVEVVSEGGGTAPFQANTGEPGERTPGRGLRGPRGPKRGGKGRNPEAAGAATNPDGTNAGKQRLHKVLAQTGLGSRRTMEALIAEGKVEVNGETAHVGQTIDPTDRVHVKRRKVNTAFTDDKPQVMIYHKPSGEIVSRDDPEGRPTVFQALKAPDHGKWVAVGRLDFNSEGLLLFTTYGELANRLMHPRYMITREYSVRVLGELSPEQEDQLIDGIELEDGPARVLSLSDEGGEGANRWYRITLQEGRNREVRRMFEMLGLTVSRLIRIRYGSITMPSWLKRGQTKLLDETETFALLTEVGLRSNSARANMKRAMKGAPSPIAPVGVMRNAREHELMRDGQGAQDPALRTARSGFGKRGGKPKIDPLATSFGTFAPGAAGPRGPRGQGRGGFGGNGGAPRPFGPAGAGGGGARSGRGPQQGRKQRADAGPMGRVVNGNSNANGNVAPRGEPSGFGGAGNGGGNGADGNAAGGRAPGNKARRGGRRGKGPRPIGPPKPPQGDE